MKAEFNCFEDLLSSRMYVEHKFFSYDEFKDAVINTYNNYDFLESISKEGKCYMLRLFKSTRKLKDYLDNRFSEIGALDVTLSGYTDVKGASSDIAVLLSNEYPNEGNIILVGVAK